MQWKYSPKHHGLYLTFQPNTLNSMEQLDCIRIYLNNIHFYCVIYFNIYHCSYGTHDTYKLTSSGSNFIFTVGMKVQVRLSVFVSKFQLFEIGCLFRCHCLGTTYTKFNGHPCIVPTLLLTKSYSSRGY